MPSARIIEAQAREGRCPIVEQPDQTSVLDVGNNVLFKEEADAEARQYRRARDRKFVERHGTTHLDLCRVAAFLEMPAVKRAIGKAAQDSDGATQTGGTTRSRAPGDRDK